MEVTLHRSDYYSYTVTIGNKSINTTWCSEYAADSIVKQWVQVVRKTYSKQKRQDLILGLSADSSAHYSNGYTDHRGSLQKNAPKDPLDLLQLCVGQHCLLLELPRTVPKALRELVDNNRTVCVGVGIEKVVKKLKEENGLVVGRAVELRRLASECLEGKGFERFSLVKLAKVVLGEEGNVVKPNTMDWLSETGDQLSDDKVKYGTVEAFLACEMGSRLSKDCPWLVDNKQYLQF